MSSKVIVVCKEMFEARGYTLLDEVCNEWGYFLKGQGTKKKRPVWVCILPMEDKFNVEMLKNYYEYFKRMTMMHIILVYRNSLTPSVKKTLHDIDVVVELFRYDELMYNILKHELVPRHTVIGHERTNHQKFPILRRTDPVARFLAFQSGDIVQIERSDGTLYIRYVK